MITAEDLHEAADLVGAFGEDESKIGEYGLPIEELASFIASSHWREVDQAGALVDLDELALAMGISIGVIAQSWVMSKGGTGGVQHPS